MTARRQKFFEALTILVVSSLIVIIFLHGHKTSLTNGSVISTNCQYGQEEIDGDTVYLYDRHKRIVEPDNGNISLAKFNAIQLGMTIEEVQNILGVRYHDDLDRKFWFGSGDAWMILYFENGQVVKKARDFDGEHEDPARWNRFWREPHQVDPNFGAISGFLPS